MEFSLDSVSDDLRFHHLHGRNATITNGGRTASRPNARGEFNDAIVMSNRPLRDNELFDVSIDKMVDRWSGSIEAGKVQRQNVPTRKNLVLGSLKVFWAEMFLFKCMNLHVHHSDASAQNNHHACIKIFFVIVLS